MNRRKFFGLLAGTAAYFGFGKSAKPKPKIEEKLGEYVLRAKKQVVQIKIPKELLV